MASAIFDQIILFESFAAGALIIAAIGMGIAWRDVLMSDGARLRLKENLGKLRVVILISLVSFYIYIIGEIAAVGGSLNILPIAYQSVHEVAEAIHLGLLVIGFFLGLRVLLVLKGEGQ